MIPKFKYVLHCFLINFLLDQVMSFIRIRNFYSQYQHARGRREARLDAARETDNNLQVIY